MCGGNFFAASNVVDIQGLLLTSSKTSFIGASFVEKQKDIVPSCLTDVIKFKIV